MKCGDFIIMADVMKKQLNPAKNGVKFGDSTEKVGFGNYSGWEMTRSTSCITSLLLYPIWKPQMHLRLANHVSPGW